MGHKWISTDSGDQCFRCGVVLDFHDEEPANGADLSDIAHRLVPGCPGPSVERAHHYVIGWQPTVAPGDWSRGEHILECAYGDARSTPNSWPANPECKGG